MTIQGIVKSLISSFGLKRKLANLFQLLTTLATTVPVLSPYATILQGIASWLGIAGVAHAAVAKTFKIDIHTVAAFFVALTLAAKSVPQLLPYVELINAIAMVLSALATGAAVSGQ